MRLLQNYLGHNSLATTALYTHLTANTEAQARAAAARGRAVTPDVLPTSMVVAREFLPFPRRADAAVLRVGRQGRE